MMKWHKITKRELTKEEKEEYEGVDWKYIFEGLPELGEDVLVTNGTRMWIDYFGQDDYLYLGTEYQDVDEVIAWMKLPEPYRESEE